MSCGLCSLVLEETQPKTTLMCGHIVHTRCFIIGVMYNDIEHLLCRECEERVVTPEINATVYPETPDSCKILEETSEEFRSCIKNIITKNKEYNKSVSKFKRIITPIISEFKAHVRPQISILKNYIKSKLSTIKETQEYKTAVKKCSEFSRCHKKISTKYNLGSYEFRNYLRSKHDYFSLYNSVLSQLERKFRIRI